MQDSVYPFYNNTFFAFSVSPLFHSADSASSKGEVTRTESSSGPSNAFLSARSLARHAASLRTLLLGHSHSFPSLNSTAPSSLSTPFGPNGSGAASFSASTGRLLTCSWSLLPSERRWLADAVRERDSDQEDELTSGPTVSPHQARAIVIKLEFERATHSAILVRNNHSDPASAASASVSRVHLQPNPSFSSFPLLLTHMPAPLRSLLVTFLSRTFDTLILPLQLGPATLSLSLERVLHTLDPDSGSATGTFDTDDEIVPLDQTVKVIQLQLSFPTANPHLKTVEVSLAKRDIIAFLDYGRELRKNRPTSGTSSARLTPDGAPDSQFVQGPFTQAIERYFQTHLALSVSNPAVRLSRITCVQFALSSDGKVKLTAPPGASVVGRRGRRGGAPSAGSRSRRGDESGGGGGDDGDDDDDSSADEADGSIGDSESPEPGSVSSPSARQGQQRPILGCQRSRPARALQAVLDLLINCALACEKPDVGGTGLGAAVVDRDGG